MFDLRPYQIAPHAATVEFFKHAKSKPGIVVAPTAFGKSVLIAHAVNEVEGKTVVLQPTKELLEQNFEKFIALGGQGSIYSASANSKKFSDVVYATIGSIKEIGDRFAMRDFKNMIIDEAHMYPRETLPTDDNTVAKSMLAKFLVDSGIKKVCGLTATPFKLQSNTDINGNRFSKLQMLTSQSKFGKLFHDIIHVTQIQEITKLNYWSKLIYEVHDFDGKTLIWNNQKSDYTEQSMFDTYEHENIEHKIIRRVRDLDDRKSILVFVPTIEIAVRLASKIPGAYAVHSKMKDDQRDWVIKRFRRLEIRVVINVNILAVGFDHDRLDCAISARPTSSLAWFYQALGRLTRIHPNKPDGLVIDFVGNVERFGRIEEIYFKKKKTWQVYGQGGRLLTGIAMDQIGSVFDAPVSGIVLDFGKHKGMDISAVPIDYIKYMLANFSWTDRNYYIKEACEQLMEHHRKDKFPTPWKTL